MQKECSIKGYEGVEFLVNAIEIYTNTNTCENCKAVAAQSIKIIADSIELAMDGNSDSLVQLNSGIGLSRELGCKCSRGCVDAISTELFNTCNTVKAKCSAVLAPVVLEGKRYIIAESLTEVATILGINTNDMNSDEGSRAVIIYLKALKKRLGITEHLVEVGVNPFDIKTVIDNTMQSEYVKTSPFQPDRETISALIKYSM